MRPQAKAANLRVMLSLSPKSSRLRADLGVTV